MILTRCVTVIVVMRDGCRMEGTSPTRTSFQSELFTLEIPALPLIPRRGGSVLDSSNVLETPDLKLRLERSNYKERSIRKEMIMDTLLRCSLTSWLM